MGCMTSKPNVQEETRSIEVELKIWMHCKKCVEDVNEAIFNVEGVEACKTDMDNHKVVVSGNFNLEGLLAKLEVELRKKALILMVTQKDEPEITENNEEDDAEKSETKLEIYIPLLCEYDLEKVIRKVISKFQGVKDCEVDVGNKKVVITGDFDKKKLRKRLDKIIDRKIKEKEKGFEEYEMNGDDEEVMKRYMMFSDDNPDACSIS